MDSVAVYGACSSLCNDHVNEIMLFGQKFSPYVHTEDFQTCSFFFFLLSINNIPLFFAAQKNNGGCIKKLLSCSSTNIFERGEAVQRRLWCAGHFGAASVLHLLTCATQVLWAKRLFTLQWWTTTWTPLWLWWKGLRSSSMNPWPLNFSKVGAFEFKVTLRTSNFFKWPGNNKNVPVLNYFG